MTAGRRQAAAVLGVLPFAAALVSLVLFLVGNVAGLVVGLLGVGVVTAGGWWVITEPMFRRGVGIAVGLGAARAAPVRDPAREVDVRRLLAATAGGDRDNVTKETA